MLGPNGAGKTTLVLHLNGIHTATSGEVFISGLSVAKPQLKEIRRRVGIVFQDPDDQLFMPTVRDDVAFGPANLGLRGDELDQRVGEALAAVGMADCADRPPHHLSFGQRRRVAAATVLAMRPDLLVLDEPSSNLDPAAGDGIHRAMQDLLAHPGLQDPRPTGRRPGNATASAATAYWPRGPGALRVSYILPSAGLEVRDAGLVWPEGDATYALVWVDIDLP